MEIIIEDEIDLYKFYKKLPLYRSLLYKKVTFTSKSHSVDDIITALNIKNRKERLTYIYDKACEKIDNHYKNENICGFKNNRCYVQQKLKNGNINGCCRFCLNQSSKGCTTKNLSCKLFNCTEVEKRCSVIKFEDLDILKLLNKRQILISKSNYFTNRKQFINDLYISSFVLWELKQILRFINIYLKLKKKSPK